VVGVLRILTGDYTRTVQAIESPAIPLYTNV
jgi:hypothetical protein